MLCLLWLFVAEQYSFLRAVRISSFSLSQFFKGNSGVWFILLCTIIHAVKLAKYANDAKDL